MIKKIQKNKSREAAIFIGTSGWVNKSWHDTFYPKKIKKDFLTFYATHFNSVEINTSFYHLPKKSTFEKWREETPDGFTCAVKMSRFITHIKKLKECKDPIELFLDSAVGLKQKLGVILIQLPPSFSFNKELLENFLADLQAVQKKKKLDLRYALEPRHPSWFESDKNLELTRDILQKNKMALVFAHSSVFPHYDPDEKENAFSKFIYIRFHGPKEFAASQYGTKLLKPWVKRIENWQAEEKTIFAYFNDDIHGYAIKDAMTLQKLLK